MARVLSFPLAPVSFRSSAFCQGCLGPWWAIPSRGRGRKPFSHILNGLQWQRRALALRPPCQEALFPSSNLETQTGPHRDFLCQQGCLSTHSSKELKLKVAVRRSSVHSRPGTKSSLRLSSVSLQIYQWLDADVNEYIHRHMNVCTFVSH